MSVHEAPPYGRHPTESLRLLTINDVAELLAISRDSVYRLVRAGKLPSLRVGARIRFRATEVDAYLERHRAPAP